MLSGLPSFLVVTAIIMAFLLMPTSWESAVTSSSESVNQVVAEVTAIPPTDIPPTLIVPTEMPALAKITVDNASQLTQTDRLRFLITHRTCTFFTRSATLLSFYRETYKR